MTFDGMNLLSEIQPTQHPDQIKNEYTTLVLDQIPFMKEPEMHHWPSIIQGNNV
jgi:hypothetical protein